MREIRREHNNVLLYLLGSAVFVMTVTAGILTLCSSAVGASPDNLHWSPLCEPGTDGWETSLQVSPFDSKHLVAGDDMYGTCYSIDAGQTWRTGTGFLGARTGDFTFHPTEPNVVWAGTGDGPYKSTDGGKTWISKRNGFPPPNPRRHTVPIQKILFDPNNFRTLLAFCGWHRATEPDGQAGSVWKSTDDGEHWQLIGTVGPSTAGDGRGAWITTAGFAAGSSSTLFACSREGGVFRSDDGGAAWRTVNSGLPDTSANFITLHPKDPNTLWVCLPEGAGVYKTTDGGSHWRRSSDGLKTGRGDNYNCIAVSISNPNVLYVASGDSTHGTYRSSDGGVTWHSILDMSTMGKIIGGLAYYLPYDNYAWSWWVSIDPRNANHVFTLPAGYIVRSNDGGATWRDITSHRVKGGWRGNGYQVEEASNIQWNPFRPLQVFAQAYDAGKLVRSSDGGWSWTTNAQGIEIFNGARSVTFSADSTIYVGTGQNRNRPNESICKSADGGVTFAYLPRPQGASGDNAAVYTLPNDSSRVWAAIGERIYRSFDGGKTWTELAIDAPGIIYNIAADLTRPTTFFVGADNGIYKTSDGVAFALIPGSPSHGNGNHVYVDPKDSAVLWVDSFHSGHGGIWRYDGAWHQVWKKEMARALAIDPGDPRRLAVITHDWPSGDVVISDGVWLSRDSGNTWTQCDDGLKARCGETIGFNPDGSGQLIVGLSGGGFYATDAGASNPRGGRARLITHAIRAVDYDEGGEGVAFHRPADSPTSSTSTKTRSTSARAIGAYHTLGNLMEGGATAAASVEGSPSLANQQTGAPRPSQSAGSESNLSNLRPGEWFKYRVKVPDIGRYKLILRSYSAAGSAKIHVYMNGVNVTGPIDIPGAGRGVSWRNVVVDDVRLDAGEQYLRLYVEDGVASLDSLRFEPEKS